MSEIEATMDPSCDATAPPRRYPTTFAHHLPGPHQTPAPFSRQRCHPCGGGLLLQADARCPNHDDPHGRRDCGTTEGAGVPIAWCAFKDHP